MKAVYCWDSGAILTCQNPLLKSIVEKCAAPAMLSNASCICGNGQESFLVHTLSLQKSTQKCSIPSFFLTSTTALHHGDWLGHMPPTSNMCQSEMHTSSSSGGGIHLNRSLSGLLSVIQISCSTMLVQPSSFPSNAKTSWKASTRSRAAMAFQGVQLLRPSRSNFSRSFLCCSATERGCHLSSAPRTASLSGDISVGRTGDAETTSPPAHPSSGRLKILTCSLPPQTPCYCSS